MKKIMFDDRFGLTNAVLSGSKTMTRRIAGELNQPQVACVSEAQIDTECKSFVRLRDSAGATKNVYSKFHLGEVVAVAQPYKSLPWKCIPVEWFGKVEKMSGYTNKMFVKAEYMPEQIRIMSVNVQRIQDICDEDCIKEGVYHDFTAPKCYQPYYTYFGSAEKNCPVGWDNPKRAFADLFDKICECKYWRENPWVWVYEFELVKEKEK